MNEVIPGVWMGGTLLGPPEGFDVVVNLEHGNDRWRTPEYLHVPMDDVDMTELMAQQVRVIATFVNKCLMAGKKVLVHCTAGLNRSGVVVGRALLVRGHTADKAIELVRRAQGPFALCNQSFEAWLRAEEKVMGNSPAESRGSCASQ